MQDLEKQPRTTAALALAPNIVAVLLVSAGLIGILAQISTEWFGARHAGFGPMQLVVLLAACALIGRGVHLWNTRWGPAASVLGLLTAERLRWLFQFAGIVLQLGLLVLIMRAFRLESRVFYDKLLVLTFFGFILHHLMPVGQRLGFFILLSLFGIWSVVGLTSGAWLVALGGVLIALCHLPVSFFMRVSLLFAVGALLIVMRTGQVTPPWPGAIWPILGSMFMFRLIVYMYDLRHDKRPVSLQHALAYFFLLPNVVFPLFPVVDYATFRRTYYDQDALSIYERGVRWIFRGMTHLLLYRLVYQYLTLPSAEVASATDLARYLVANFLLYLRVSGQFHLIVGILHLFGFRLPETHHFFYLASSFTDFWRRINIYWKDFMQKLVYYPTYFRLRKWGETSALVASTLVVFFATWLLHAYQWFWILGSFLLTWTDVLFWAILSVLLVGNALLEVRRGRKRGLAQQRRSFRELALNGVRTAATFTVICILWSLWTSPSVSDWLGLWSAARIDAGDLGRVAAGALAAFGVLLLMLRFQNPAREQKRRPIRSARLRAVGVAAGLLLIYASATPAVRTRLDWRTQQLLRDLQMGGLNKSDASLLHRGYYEALTGVNRFNSQLWEVYAYKPSDWPFIWFTPAGRKVGGFMRDELVPMAGITFRGAPFRTNRWGMRDKDYQKLPPPNTYRTALLGPSHAMGAGVADNEVFESVLEARLNRRDRSQGARAIEILNFSVEGYSPTQQVQLLADRAIAFRPSAIFMTGNLRDPEQASIHLWQLVRDSVPVPFPFLETLIQGSGLRSERTEEGALKRLRPHESRLVLWAYQRIVALCREHGIRPIWVYVPMPGDNRAEPIAALRGLAVEAGFEVIDASDAFAGRDVQSLQVATWDRHPNGEGHRLIAERINQELSRRPELLQPLAR